MASSETLEGLAQQVSGLPHILLVDTSILGTSYLRVVYNRHRYRNVDIGELRKEQERAATLESMFRRPNVYTVRGVVEELQQESELWRERLRFFNSWERDKKHAPIEYPIEKKFAEELAFLQLNATRAARHAIYNPKETELYARIYGAVQELSQRLRLKERKQTFQTNIVEREKRSVDHGTDEALIALGLYLSLAEELPSSIVSEDHDLVWLLATCVDVLTATQYLPFSPVMRARLHRFPCQLYLGNHQRGRFDLAFDTDKKAPHRLPGNWQIPFGELQGEIYCLLRHAFKPVADFRPSERTVATPLAV